MRARERRTWTAVGLLVATALAAAPAQASVDAFVAAGPNGSAHFAWFDGSPNPTIFERTLHGNGALGGAQMASQAYRPADTQSIGVDADGNAILAWRQGEGDSSFLRTRRRAADGALSAIQLVSPAGVHVDSYKLAVEPDGDAVYVWERDIAGKTVVQARRRTAAGVLSAIQTLSYAGADAYGADVAVAPDGTATAAWLRGQSDGKTYVQTRAIASGGALSPVKNVTAPTSITGYPRITVGDAGTAVIAWARTAGTSDFTVQSRARTAAGTLGVTQTISGPQAGSVVETAGNAAGRTVYTWIERVDGQIIHRGRVRQAGGALGPAFTVAAEPTVEPRVAVDPDGNATFVWQDIPTASSVYSRRRSAAGAMGVVRTLSEPDVRSISPHVAVDAAGKATVVFFVVGAGDFVSRTITPTGMSPLLVLSDE